MPDLQFGTLETSSYKNVEDTFVFLTQKVFISANFSNASSINKCASNFRKETANGNKHFKETNH